jgi:hypothetical protein
VSGGQKNPPFCPIRIEVILIYIIPLTLLHDYVRIFTNLPLKVSGPAQNLANQVMV